MKFLLVVAATLAVACAGRVDIKLQLAVQTGDTDEAIIELPSIMTQIENNVGLQSLKGDAKVTALISSLKGLTGASQAPFVTVAQSLGLKIEQFWSANIIHVQGLTPETLNKLALVPGEFTIRPPFTASIFPVVVGEEVAPSNISQTYQWGVEKIGAPGFWGTSDGAGCIAAIVDTGVNLGHTALADSYAGVWADPNHNTAGPTDQHGHGSHCAGSILGRANGVGVAPGARWIGCRGLNHQGSGSEQALTSCSQTLIGANPKPNVVSNSWGGGAGQTWYNQQVSAYRQANIIPVFAIGNSGPSCRSANSPGDQPNLISCGATTNTDAMAGFSSRGAGPGNSLKPEVSAPGNNIVSCGTGANNYVTMSGTSMATPHVAGAVCLLIGENPDITFDQILARLTANPEKPTLSAADRNCGLPNAGQDFPNHAYGHGRIHMRS